jgi:hypothetical protein
LGDLLVAEEAGEVVEGVGVGDSAADDLGAVDTFAPLASM